MFKKALCCVLYYALFSPISFAAAEGESQAAAVDYQYFQLEPDIITNYIKPGKNIGYVRVSVDLMVKSSSDYEEIEIHDPLIRDRIITIFGEQNEQQIKTMADREAIRQRCLSEVNEVLFEVVGHRPVKDLHFTKYLYQ
ncbi:flagellar basal body-associated FliL family protein [Psychromonas sp.]|nr:flagellar basal body-associated FliL family protein [Psychromonas sp.]